VALYDPQNDGAVLALLTLGVVGDDRPLRDMQPPLPEGIHLRWGITPERGFPWYGFYLFRRPSLTSGVATCVAPQLLAAGHTPGTVGTTLSLPLGTFDSDQNIRLTEEFPPTNTVELDLSGRSFLRFAASTRARRVDIKIGFVADFPPPGGGGPGGPGDPGGPDPGDPGPGGGPGGGPDGGLGTGGAGSGGCECICGGANAGIQPILHRVIALGNGLYRATFGYFNPGAAAVSIPVGPQNQFVPNPTGRGQPTLFFPGFHRNVFSVDFDGRAITWSLGGLLAGASSSVAVPPTAADGILIIAFRFGFPVGFRLVTGRAGQVVTVPAIAFESIDSIVISSGPARLVDLCTVPASDGVGLGWGPVPDFPQPMTLPVRHPQYPPRSGPENPAESEAFALDRITYRPPDVWGGDNFAALHAALVEIVQAGPSGGITDFKEIVTAEADPADPDAVPPEIEESSLSALLIASMNPAVAQMLGLYWIDDATVEGQSYDYMLVADYTNAGGGSANTILGLLQAENFTNIEAYLKIGALRAASPPLTPPQDLKAYALPIGAVSPPTPGDAAGLVGLRWRIPGEDAQHRLAADSALSYHLWRKDFGRSKPAGPAPDGEYLRVTELPLSAGEMREDDLPPPLTGWPTAGLFAVDGPLVDGWYGYRVSGIDVFGRHSARSEAAPWLDVVDDHELTTVDAVNLIDTKPPPPPTRVQAWLLDPGDPFVLQDAAYAAWRTPTPPVPGRDTTIGLRVRWVWNGKHMLQAPDAREFRVYINAGASLVDAAVPTSWLQRIAIVGMNEQIVDESTAAVRAKDNTALAGSSFSIAGDTVTLNDVGTLPDGNSRLTGVAVDALELELRTSGGLRSRFAVVEINVADGKVKVSPAPSGSGFTSWTLGIRERTYELFLPGASLAVPPAFTLPFSPSLTTPIVYGLVGVSAADDKNNEIALVDNRPSGPLSGRPGNEGAVGGPATVYQVLRDKPTAPESPFTEERLFATRADFHSRSFFNLHWLKSSVLSAHIFRALDQTLFQVDSGKGFGPNARDEDLDTPNLYPDGWSTARQNAAADQISDLSSMASYASLSDDALRVLASFPSNAPAFSCLTAAALPSTTPDLPGPTDPAGYTGNPALGSYLDTLDGRAENRYFYRTSFLDGAQNAGPLGMSTPPVYLPPVVLPDTPVMRGAVASEDELEITLTWATSRSASVTAYHIYRTDEPARARDVRLMERIQVVAEVAPPGRPVTRSFEDEDVQGTITYAYRVVAVTADGRSSKPSAAFKARAIDVALPTVPTLTAEWTTVNNVTLAELSWTSEDETLLQQRPATRQQWISLGTWRPPGAYSIRDPLSVPTVDFQYRLVVRKYTGAISRGDAVTLVKQ
jgi:hypothetical protein